MGPSALRKAGLVERLSTLVGKVVDAGDIVTPGPASSDATDSRLRFLPEITAACNALASQVRNAVEESDFPLVLGGDHSMSIGTLAGLALGLEGSKRMGVLWIDAHADCNTPQTSPSGNIHGMPLAVAMGFGAPELLALRGECAVLDPGALVYIGLRSVDVEERNLIHRLGIRAYTMRDIDESGIAGVTRSALDYLLPRCDFLHASLDLDVMDPEIAPGVGTPVPGGLTYREGHYLMESIALTGRLDSMEIAEVNPVLDRHNASSELAVDLVASLLGQRVL